MSQNNSDNAAYYTAQHKNSEYQMDILHLSSKMEQVKEKLEEISKVPAIEGATQLTITSLIQYKVEQAIKIIDG
jgi:hypothetical protein|tara:strand:- start:966 stop:1187 length:222 start_codon:yes stop_codon:yes gene_type:complete